MKTQLAVFACLLIVQARAQTYDWSDSISSGSNYTHFDLNIGMGSTVFTPRKQNVQKPEYNQLYYFFGAGYYHKSGLNVSFQSYSTEDQNAFVVYQTMVTAAYDYERYNYETRKGIGWGASYTRLFNRDSVSFYQSPLKNQYYGYFKWMNRVVTPMVSFTYGSGKTTVVRPLPLPPRRVNVDAHEYNVSFSLSHDFLVGGQTHGEQKFEPSLNIYAGKNQYGGLNSRQRQVATRFTDESFQLQDITLNAGYTYTHENFYLQPELMLDYFYPKAYSKWYFSFSLTLGYEFW